ncbi:TetR/AcrR family transcriptional regulator [Actinomycetospora sp. TBRC 11914]|uniref:TetR/AcrR family transcriptional regulator n=1 Tax=Actinomycetospora sp. TBRC 11914 TaxID=2729387 RepID=UPI00145F4861|nr:TetR/AcrR family transcriptional regulator [Actinomycetospora sp. TBRC 11914]NMO89364.1 TetR/AcrR family transcriptional regulator [Actinomycetospora sp. TBRC 11914]
MTRSAVQAELRERLVAVAVRSVADHGVEALRAREVCAEVGTSTQALYTLFGGMPGLIEAAVAAGFVGLAGHVDAVPESDDPVADHLVKGWAYTDWALARPSLYRAMFGVTDPSLRHHVPVETTMAATHLAVGDGRTALDVLVRSVSRMVDAGRLRPAEPLPVARQFLSATHGYVLLELAGAFGEPGGGLATMAELAVTLLVGLGDAREDAERSLLAAVAAHQRLVAGEPSS